MRYGKDLAFIHDAGFGNFARQAGPGLLRLLATHSIKDGRVLDLGCGSGIWAAALVNVGYEVLGIDFSPDMITLAHKRVPAGRFIAESFFNVTFPQCAAVTCMGECLNYQSSETSRRDDPLPRLFAKICASLQPGGLFIFDILEPGCEKGTKRQSHKIADDWAVLVDVEENPRKTKPHPQHHHLPKKRPAFSADQRNARSKIIQTRRHCRSIAGAGIYSAVFKRIRRAEIPKASCGFSGQKEVTMDYVNCAPIRIGLQSGPSLWKREDRRDSNA